MSDKKRLDKFVKSLDLGDSYGFLEALKGGISKDRLFKLLINLGCKEPELFSIILSKTWNLK